MGDAPDHHGWLHRLLVTILNHYVIATSKAPLLDCYDVDDILYIVHLLHLDCVFYLPHRLAAGNLYYSKVHIDCKQYGIKRCIPHHAIVTPTKNTTKVRVVYDASAKTRQINKCLNDCLYRGQVILPDLCGMFIKFCLHPTPAVIADVEKALLNMGPHIWDRCNVVFMVKESEGYNCCNLLLQRRLGKICMWTI